MRGKDSTISVIHIKSKKTSTIFKTLYPIYDKLFNGFHSKFYSVLSLIHFAFKLPEIIPYGKYTELALFNNSLVSYLTTHFIYIKNRKTMKFISIMVLFFL